MQGESREGELGLHLDWGNDEIERPQAAASEASGPATKTNPTTGAFQVSDELWEVLAP